MIFYVGINMKTQHTTQKQNNQHHGELPSPPAARILQLYPIFNKHDTGEGLGEGAVEAIQSIRLIDRVLIYLLATLFTTKK